MPLTATRQLGVFEPIKSWLPHDDRKVVFYGITHHKQVLTSCGLLMERVSLDPNVDLYNPSNDIAANLGWVDNVSNGEWRTDLPELWYWRDAFWLKGRKPGKGVWYLDGDYLLYPTTVVNPDAMFQLVAAEREEVLKFI